MKQESDETYWIPLRTIAGTKKDKWLECSQCGHKINMHDIEQLRFTHRNRPDIYENEIKTRYAVCESCGSPMNRILSHLLQKRHMAKGDPQLEQIVKKYEKNEK